MTISRLVGDKGLRHKRDFLPFFTLRSNWTLLLLRECLHDSRETFARLSHDSREIFVRASHDSRETFVRVSHDVRANFDQFYSSQ